LDESFDYRRRDVCFADWRGYIDCVWGYFRFKFGLEGGRYKNSSQSLDTGINGVIEEIKLPNYKWSHERLG